MAITINGTGTITGVSVGGLPDGIVDTDMLANDAVSAAKLQSTAIAAGDLPSGSILQVVSSTKSDTSSATGYSWTDTGLSVSITPVAASSKILVLADMNIGSNIGFDIKLRLMRGSTPIGLGDAVGSRPQVTKVVNTYSSTNYAVYHLIPTSIIHLDEPTYTLTDSITYKVQFATYDTNLVYLNRSSNNSTDTNNEYEGTPASFITVMEVAG